MCLMKRWNVAAPRHALQRGVQDLATDPDNPLLLPVAGAAGLDAGLKTEPADGGSGIPRRTIRRCWMGVVSLKRNKPVHAPQTADGTLAPAAAAPVALEVAVHGDLVQMFTPP